MAGLPFPMVLATGNPDKAREINEIFVTEIGEPLAAWAVTAGPDTFGFVLDRPADLAARLSSAPELDVAPDVEETGSTLEENARIKANALCDAMRHGCRRRRHRLGSRRARWRTRHLRGPVLRTGRNVRGQRRQAPRTSSRGCIPHCERLVSRPSPWHAGPTDANSSHAAKSKG